MEKRNRRVEWLTIGSNAAFLLAAAVIAFSAWNVARENRALVAAIQQGQQGATAQSQFQPGDSLPNVRLVRLDGEETTMSELARQVKVLAVLTTTCPFCKQSLPAWNDLAVELEAHAMGFAGISLHSVGQTRDYVRDNEIAWPVLVVEPSDMPSLGIRTVPHALVVSEAGVVDEAIRGMFKVEDAEEMLRGWSPRR